MASASLSMVEYARSFSRYWHVLSGAHCFTPGTAPNPTSDISVWTRKGVTSTGSVHKACLWKSKTSSASWVQSILSGRSFLVRSCRGLARVYTNDSRTWNCNHFGCICSWNCISAISTYLGAFVWVQIIIMVRLVVILYKTLASKPTAQRRLGYDTVSLPDRVLPLFIRSWSFALGIFLCTGQFSWNLEGSGPDECIDCLLELIHWFDLFLDRCVEVSA